MPPRSRYAVDPSLTAQAPSQQYDQNPQYQQPYTDPSVNPILHPNTDRRTPPPAGPYALSGPSTLYQNPQHGPPPPHLHPSYIAPENHIAPPPHSSGPQVSGPRVRIDPSQMPNPIEAQEMDQNLYDEEDFLSCQTRGVIPLAGTDWRGVDQGESRLRTTEREKGGQVSSAASKLGHTFAWFSRSDLDIDFVYL